MIDFFFQEFYSLGKEFPTTLHARENRLVLKGSPLPAILTAQNVQIYLAGFW